MSQKISKIQDLEIQVEQDQDDENIQKFGQNSPNGPITANRKFKFISDIKKPGEMNNSKFSQDRILAPKNQNSLPSPKNLQRLMTQDQAKALPTTPVARGNDTSQFSTTPGSPKGAATKYITNNRPTSNVAQNAQSAYKSHLLNTFQSMRYVKFMLNGIDEDQLNEKQILLPKRKSHLHKKTVIFDLDETLVHCNRESTESHVQIEVKFPDGQAFQAGVNIRPFAIECLTEASKNFEVIVFTASHRCYADQVLDHLDPNRRLIHHRLYREHWIYTNGIFVKDLRILSNRRMQDIVIVDNNAYSFGYQVDNGIPIISWFQDMNDRELYNLIDYLKVLSLAKDIRLVNRHTFRLHSFYEDFIKDYGDPFASPCT